MRAVSGSLGLKGKFLGSVVAVCCVLYCVGIIHPIASDMRTATMDRKLMCRNTM